MKSAKSIIQTNKALKTIYLIGGHMERIYRPLDEYSVPAIRANAALGFAYIVRTKGKLEKHIVKPIMLKELKDNFEFNRRINDALDDIIFFMKWNLGSKARD